MIEEIIDSDISIEQKLTKQVNDLRNIFVDSCINVTSSYHDMACKNYYSITINRNKIHELLNRFDWGYHAVTIDEAYKSIHVYDGFYYNKIKNWGNSNGYTKIYKHF